MVRGILFYSIKEKNKNVRRSRRSLKGDFI